MPTFLTEIYSHENYYYYHERKKEIHNFLPDGAGQRGAAAEDSRERERDGKDPGRVMMMKMMMSIEEGGGRTDGAWPIKCVIEED